MGRYNVNIYNGKIQCKYLQWEDEMYIFTMGRSDVDIYNGNI